MDDIETCVICRTSDTGEAVVGWYIGAERRTVHVDCWIRAHRRETEAAAPALGDRR